jgi:hypothetical protein
MSSRFLTCLLRALGALLQSLRELVVTVTDRQLTRTAGIHKVTIERVGPSLRITSKLIPGRITI